MFFGKHKANVDKKGRVAVPARLRDRVAANEKDQFVMTVLPEACLALYPLSEWDRIAAEIAERAKTSLGWQEARDLERVLFTNAVDVACDKQGRILVPADLRQRAGIDKEVMFAGVRNRIELWSREAWDVSQVALQATYGRVAQQVLG